MEMLLREIAGCRFCEPHLTHGARPVVSGHGESKIVIVGQAPGLAVHQSGIPWDDKSGDTLRQWMQVDKATFYDPKTTAIIPMGFCYPGRGRSGDLPPRKECAPLWHQRLMDKMNNIQLIVLIGRYAQLYYLGSRSKNTLTETIRNYKDYLPEYFVLPHPSPRNNIWQAKNDWFIKQVIPEFRNRIKEVLA